MALLSRKIDMTGGTLWDKIIAFALPLAFTGVLQQLLNAADVAVLGQYLGKNAMAAVGNNTALIGLTVNLFIGLSLGANVVIAQNIGANRKKHAHDIVGTAFLLAIITGFFVAAVGEAAVDFVMNRLGVPLDVWDMAETYLRVYLLGMPVIGLYNFEAAIFRSRGDTTTPLIALIVAVFLNIGLNLLAVGYFSLGIAGVAAATVLAFGAATIVLFVALIRTDDAVIRLSIKKLHINKAGLSEIVRIGLPAGIQGMVFSLSNIIIQGAINSLGADVMAASAAAFTIEINVFCFLSAFGQATTTFVSQNYGAGLMERCRKVTRIAMGLSTLFMGVLSGVILYYAQELLAFFNDDPAVIAFGIIRIWYVVAPEVINVVLEGLSGAMRGFGVSLLPAVLTLVGICGIRIGWVYTIFAEAPSYESLMIVYPMSWLVTMFLIIAAYFWTLRHLKVFKETLHK